ncbi:MAG: alanine racemase [Pseudomonadales bacterium]|nr:alanine racemase [Pseudomonadales bacterium]
MRSLGNIPQAIIHLDAIQRNFAKARKYSPDSKTMVVVKADAYGHGAIKVCQQLKAADGFAVARVVEGIELRQAGIDNQLVILEGFLGRQELKLCRELNLIPVVHNERQLEIFDDGPCWIKIDTGMNRLGFKYTADSLQLAELVTTIGRKNIIGLMSHLAHSEQRHHVANSTQLGRYLQVAEKFDLAVETSIANSSALLELAETRLGWIRPGIMIYGGSALGRPDSRLEAGMTLTAPILAIKSLVAGDAVGYGGLWQATEACRIAVVGLGYADGYPREMPANTPVLVDGQRRSLIGRVSMDMSFIKLTDQDRVDIGDPVVFWGADLPIDEIAAYANTLSYTLMSGLTQRVQKVYGEN